jgi:hypothetical protein
LTPAISDRYSSSTGNGTTWAAGATSRSTCSSASATVTNTSERTAIARAIARPSSARPRSMFHTTVCFAASRIARSARSAADRRRQRPRRPPVQLTSLLVDKFNHVG